MILRREVRQGLMIRFSSMITRRKEPCAWLRLNENPSLVRMSQREIKEYDGEDFLVEKEKLIDLIERKTEEEELTGKGENEKGIKIQLSYFAAVLNLFSGMVKKIQENQDWNSWKERKGRDSRDFQRNSGSQNWKRD